MSEAESRPLTPPLPPGVKPLSHQVAGHVHGKNKDKIGFLECGDDTVLKPVQAPPKGLRELEFYQEVFSPECGDPDLLSLKPFLPAYLGTFDLPDQGGRYFRLEDITKKFRRPCIMDAKIGPVTWDPEADDEKIEREKQKYPPVTKTGFQLIGIKICLPDGSYKHLDRFFLRSLDEEQILHQGLAAFLSPDGKLRKDLIHIILQKLDQIESWFLSQRKYLFFASSLLLVYDASSDVPSSIENGFVSSTSSVDIRMIDMAHVFPTDQADQNYLFGLRGLIKYLKKLL